jgi:hypothetical protein
MFFSPAKIFFSHLFFLFFKRKKGQQEAIVFGSHE